MRKNKAKTRTEEKKGGTDPIMRQSKEEQARKARNEYYREWRRKNPEKVKAAMVKYWANKAEKQQERGSEHERTN